MSRSIILVLILLILNSCKQIKDDAKTIDPNDQPTQDNETPTTSIPVHRVINFDTDPLGVAFSNRQLLNAHYSEWGVAFAISSDSPKIINQATDPSDAIPISSPFLLGGNLNTGLSSTEPLTITFTNTASNIKFYVVDVESGGGSATFKDSLGNIKEVISFQNLNSGASQLISSTQNEIKIIELTNGSTSDGFFIDDLEFDTTQ